MAESEHFSTSALSCFFRAPIMDRLLSIIDHVSKNPRIEKEVKSFSSWSIKIFFFAIISRFHPVNQRNFLLVDEKE